MVDRETIIETGDGGAAGIIAGVLLVAIIAVGAFFFLTTNTNRGQTIDIDVPAVSVDVVPDGQ